MQLTFLGVRGSTPAPGAEFVRYGGNTSCVAVTLDGATTPSVVLDAGTGLRALTPLLGGASFQGSILVSHLHWDHVQGIPFFNAGDREGSRVHVVVPEQHGQTGRDLIAQLLSPPAFPITPEGLRGSWSFTAVPTGPFEVEGVSVTAVDVVHKGGRTFGYRLDADGVSVAYLPDHAPAAGVGSETLAALAGVDVLIHDAQFLDAERVVADDYAHATISDAIGFARRINAGTLVLFHHSPARVDDALDRVLDGVDLDGVVVAREGLVLDVARVTERSQSSGR
jgi:phosphoribosyl 1,2-cyclic phosphodiesterase